VKIYISNLQKGLDVYNGKSKFINYLADYLVRRGHILLDDPFGCDINLSMNKLPSVNEGILVTRLDDIYFCNDPVHDEVYKKGYNRIIEALSSADAIIYQSHLSKGVVENITSISPIHSRIIYNGAPSSPLYTPWDIPIPSNKRIILFACQKLFPLRRLEEFLTTWLTIKPFYPDHVLALVYTQDAVYGHIDYLLDDSSVYVFDCMEPSNLNYLMSRSELMVSLKYQDSCPNIIAEAAQAGLPSLISSTNGWAGNIHAINSGYLRIANVDSYCTIDFHPYEIFPFNYDEFRSSLCHALDNPPRPSKSNEFDIIKSCRSYESYFDYLIESIPKRSSSYFRKCSYFSYKFSKTSLKLIKSSLKSKNL